MTSPPTALAVGDELPASWLASLLAALDTASQITSWGSGFLSTPPAGSQLIRQRGSISATTNASGVVNVTLPAAFPNGLAWWSAVTTNGNIGVIRSALTGAGTSTIVFVCYTLAGAAAASQAVSFVWEAEGW